MSDTPSIPTTPNSDDAGGDAKKKWALIAGVLVIVAALIAVLFVIGGDDDASVTTSEASETTAVSNTTIVADTTIETTVETTQAPTTTESTATTEVAETTVPDTTVAPPVSENLRSAVWPWVDTDTRYAEPVEAATVFAADFLGFVEPIVGEFMAGDSRSGEVEVRAYENGPATVIFVRQLTDDDSWWILGAGSANITVDEPKAQAEITSPLTVSGTATAFEGTVDVELRADGNGEPIFEGFVTGGALEPGAFSGTFEFSSPGATGGALVMLSISPKDGSTMEAAVLRVFYR